MASQFPGTRAPQHPGASAPRPRSLHIVGAHSNFTKVAPITSLHFDKPFARLRGDLSASDWAQDRPAGALQDDP